MIFASGVIFRYAQKMGYNVLGTETIGAAQRHGSIIPRVRNAESQSSSPLAPRRQAKALVGFDALEMMRYIEKLSLKGKYLLNMHKIPTVTCNMGFDQCPSDEELKIGLAHLGVEGCMPLS
jgi:Pyruvate/2-oxoacid:ferredoxin oxidoreductase gamma subunit